MRLSEHTDFDSNTHIPLFVAAKITNQGVLDVIDPLDKTNKTSKFCLVFYPNPQEPPTGLDPTIVSLVKEYWSSIQPMIICRDMSGYYLGSPKDNNILIFEQCEPQQGECWISKIFTGFSDSLCYTVGEPEFSEERMYLRKVSKLTR